MSNREKIVINDPLRPKSGLASLQIPLAESYSSHPYFSDKTCQLNVDEQALADFEESCRSYVHRSQDVSLRAVKHVLDAVFHSMIASTEDANLLLFLRELRELTWDLAKKDLAFLKKSARRSAPDANNSAIASERFWFGSLEQKSVAAILKAMQADLAVLRERSAHGSRTREELSINSGRTVRKVTRHLMRDFRDQGVLRNLSPILPGRPRITGLAIELSVAGSTWWNNRFTDLDAPGTMYAHLDESIEAPKAIVYLTDVNETNGPTGFYPRVYEQLQLSYLQDVIGRVLGKVGSSKKSPLHAYYHGTYHQSMSSASFRQHFMALPAHLRFNSHFGWDLHPSAQITQELVSREVLMTGAPGTYVVFDGARLLHRGGLIQEGERVALQVVFGVTPQLIRVIRDRLSRLSNSVRTR
jgi:hypothetical protein